MESSGLLRIVTIALEAEILFFSKKKEITTYDLSLFKEADFSRIISLPFSPADAAIQYLGEKTIAFAELSRHDNFIKIFRVKTYLVLPKMKKTVRHDLTIALPNGCE